MDPPCKLPGAPHEGAVWSEGCRQHTLTIVVRHTRGAHMQRQWLATRVLPPLRTGPDSPCGAAQHAAPRVQHGAAGGTAHLSRPSAEAAPGKAGSGGEATPSPPPPLPRSGTRASTALGREATPSPRRRSALAPGSTGGPACLHWPPEVTLNHKIFKFLMIPYLPLFTFPKPLAMKHGFPLHRLLGLRAPLNCCPCFAEVSPSKLSTGAPLQSSLSSGFGVKGRCG